MYMYVYIRILVLHGCPKMLYEYCVPDMNLYIHICTVPTDEGSY